MDTGYGARGPSAVRLVWIYPDLLSTYGDRGNLLVLARRARLRGIPVEIAEVNSDQRVPADGDIYLTLNGETRFRYDNTSWKNFDIAPSATPQITAWGNDPFNRFGYYFGFGMRWNLDLLAQAGDVHPQ